MISFLILENREKCPSQFLKDQGDVFKYLVSSVQNPKIFTVYDRNQRKTGNVLI